MQLTQSDKNAIRTVFYDQDTAERIIQLLESSESVTTDEVENESNVTGATATDALNALYALITGGALQFQGLYDPTATGDYPIQADTIGGVPILKGFFWVISVNGTVNGNAVTAGDAVFALVNAAGATTDADWTILAGAFVNGIVQSVTGATVDNTDPLNPVVNVTPDGVTITGDGSPGNPFVATAGSGVSCYTRTVAQAQIDLPTFTLGSKVFITDADSTNGGALFDVVKDADGNTALSPDGTGLFLNADLYGDGDYSGVLAVTGVAPGTQTGVWNRLTGDINYFPEVTSTIDILSGTNFTIGDILAGNNASVAEILDFGTTITVQVPDTTGMQAGDAIDLKDAGAVTLQSGVITTVVDSTHIIVGSLTGSYLDAAIGFDNYDDTTQTLTGSIANIFYQLILKVTAGDWGGASTLTNQSAPNDTATIDGLSYNAFVVGQNVTNSNTGSVGLIIADSGSGTSPATLSVKFFGNSWNDGDILTGDTGQIAYQDSTVVYTHTYATEEFCVWNNANYQCIDDTQDNGDSPDNNPAWYYLDRADANVGYILKADKILGYNLSNNHWKMRWDQENECIINHWSRNSHQWGDVDIRVQMTNGSVFYNSLNNRGEIRHTITASHSSIYEVENDLGSELYGDISGTGHDINAYSRSNCRGVLDISGSGCYIDIHGNVAGRDVVTLTGDGIAIYGYECYEDVNRIITAAGTEGHHDYSISSGERVISSNGDNNISESWEDSGSCYLQIIGASNGYYGAQGSGDVTYYLDNASIVFANANTGTVRGRITDASLMVYDNNAGGISFDEISGGFFGQGSLDFGFSRTHNKLSANDQFYVLPVNVDYISGEELTNTFSTYEVELDAQDNYGAGGDPTGILTIPAGMKYAGYFKLTTMVQGTMVVTNESGAITTGNTLQVLDGLSNLIAVGLNILAYDAMAHTITFECLMIGSFLGTPLDPTDVFLTGAATITDGSETADFVSCAGGTITTVDGDVPIHPFVFYSDYGTVNNFFTDSIWSVSHYGNIFSDGGKSPHVLWNTMGNRSTSDQITLQSDGTNNVMNPSPTILQ